MDNMQKVFEKVGFIIAMIILFFIGLLVCIFIMIGIVLAGRFLLDLLQSLLNAFAFMT